MQLAHFGARARALPLLLPLVAALDCNAAWHRPPAPQADMDAAEKQASLEEVQQQLVAELEAARKEAATTDTQLRQVGGRAASQGGLMCMLVYD